MPSPIGHALGGLIIAFAAAPARQRRHEDGQILRAVRGLRSQDAFITWCVVAACLPDVDFAWGRHNMETHSIGFALLLGVAILAWTRSTRMAIACAVAAGTHVLFDWLGSDDSPPLGVMALWPFDSEFYFAEAYIFSTISRRYWLPGFIEHNVLSVLREVVILLPLTVVSFFLRRTTAGRRVRPPRNQ